ncbi:hypothetical protein R3W88_032149 [Solanum pinnatisectum]|uniref:Uncharacterized protein n=1 Tax=Solanum pinnatisectum TaxID=50273 RepID=A0AAV9LPN6_9SOLN|nr:hypothetical protein R3W88_032149 [Solanum pinnatisectum]
MSKRAGSWIAFLGTYGHGVGSSVVFWSVSKKLDSRLIHGCGHPCWYCAASDKVVK